MAHFSVDVTNDQPECVLTVSGELDAEHAPQLASMARVAMTSPSWGVLVIDLTNVSFVDSTGLGAVVDLHAAATRAGRAVRLRGVRKPVRRVIEITGLADLLLVSTPRAAPNHHESAVPERAVSCRSEHAAQDPHK